MPFKSIAFRPGVNTMMTPSQNEAGVSQSNLVRYQQGMIQKLGGWATVTLAVNSTVRELWAWQDLPGNDLLAAGCTGSSTGGGGLVLTSSVAVTDITPLISIRNLSPSVFSVPAGQHLVNISDSGAAGISSNSWIFFNTQVNVGNIILQGAYQINSVISSTLYEIDGVTIASSNATAAVLPYFQASSGSKFINVAFPANGYQSINGLYEPFIAPTTFAGITIQGSYQISAVLDSSDFVIVSSSPATTTANSTMNGGQVQIVYYIPGTGAAFVTATDWSLANWGSVLLAVPSGGPLYQWSDQGISPATATVVGSAPFFNGGCFVSQPQQILVLWGSTQSTGVRNPLIVRWSNALDYTNYVVSNQTWAGSFTIPTGSVIKGGIQSAQQGIIWTDIECWVMQNVGLPVVFGFTRVGSGCGLVGQHAMGILDGNVFWMGFSNFHVLSGEGVQAIPCSVWNFVFEQIDTANYAKVRCAVNALYKEVAWFFPVAGGSGENSVYVKYNTLENAWDYGSLGRSAWIDVSVLGNPIGSDLFGNILQHERGYSYGGVALDSTFTSGYWAIAEGEELAFVDWILPDMTFNIYPGSLVSASVNITFLVVNYLGDTPAAYGPYTFGSTTEFINVRIRGRFMAVKIENNTGISEFWRIGRIRYRYAIAGRR